MFSFLKAKGSYIIVFLLAFLLLTNISVLSTNAQEDPEVLTAPIEQDESAYIEALEDAWVGEEWENEDLFDWDYGNDTLSPLSMSEEMEYEDVFYIVTAFVTAWLIFMVPLYIYYALTLMVTAKKLGLKNNWFAWIPVLQLVLLFQCANLNPWLILLIFVPFVNMIVLVYTYMKIAERRGFESWLGILIVLPIANLIIPGYLAWGEPPKKEA